MSDQFEYLIRDSLNNLAEEAKPVDLTTPALAQAHRRRKTALMLGAAATAAAVMLAVPFALAAGAISSAPAAPAAIPTPSPTDCPPVPDGYRPYVKDRSLATAPTPDPMGKPIPAACLKIMIRECIAGLRPPSSTPDKSATRVPAECAPYPVKCLNSGVIGSAKPSPTAGTPVPKRMPGVCIWVPAECQKVRPTKPPATSTPKAGTAVPWPTACLPIKFRCTIDKTPTAAPKRCLVLGPSGPSRTPYIRRVP